MLSAGGQNGVRLEMAAQPFHDIAHLHRTGHLRMREIFEIVGMGRPGPVLPHRRSPRLQLCRLREETRDAGIDRQSRVINAPQLLRARMNVNEQLLRDRNVDQRIGASGHLPETGADGDQKVAILHMADQLRPCGKTEVAEA